MTALAAASITLRQAGGAAFAVPEGPNGPRFPNGFVPIPTATPTPILTATPTPIPSPVPGPLPGPITANRWWDPALRVTALAPDPVARFLASTDPIALPQAPEAGIGWGPGLTPAGDDVVVGMLIALRASGASAEATALATACAGGETTPLSRALLDHAARGEAVRPLLDLVSALAGQGDLDRAVARLHGFGATSGRHLIEGARRALTDRGAP